MNKQGRVLLVDDDEDVLFAGRLFLKQYFKEVLTETRPDKALSLIRLDAPDLILLDMNFTRDVSGGEEGFYWLGRFLEADRSAVIVLITAYGDIEMAVRAMKNGATDFVQKPWQNEKLLATLMAAYRLRISKVEAESMRQAVHVLGKDADSPFVEMIGSSARMQQVVATIGKVAATDANVLILGENGTGKELVARALHRQSLRKDKIFVSVDVGSLSHSLFESELFGHVKGAFTDAREDRPGRFEVASGGTLFLDEIGNIPPAQQSKLLSVLQERKVVRVGSSHPKSFDIRLISATNRPLHDLAIKGDFRQDLLYRINTIEIQLPALRERRSDVPELAAFFMKKYQAKYRKNFSGITEEALQFMQTYAWPGNIRELEHAVERAVILAEGDWLKPGDFHLNPLAMMSDKPESIFDLEEIEKNTIRKVLASKQGNITHAAAELGITRAALYRRMEKFGL